jgi:hypothetical protein
MRRPGMPRAPLAANWQVAAASFGLGVAESAITRQIGGCETTLYDVVDAGTGVNWYSGALGLDSATANRLPGVVRGIYRFASAGKGPAAVIAAGATYVVGSLGPVPGLPATPCSAP